MDYLLKISKEYKKFLVVVPGILFGIYFIFKAGVSISDGKQFTLSDDIMISMTYAKTFSNTGILNWYKGSEFVQGYTNFFWTLLMVIIHYFGFSGSINALIISLINLILVFFVSITTIDISNKINNKNVNLNLFLGFLIPFQYPLIFWSYRGFEITLYIYLLLQILKIHLFTDNNKEEVIKNSLYKTSLLAIFGFFTRLDFLFPLLIIQLILLKKFIKNKNLLKVFFIGNFISFLFLVLLLSFQKYYYGSFLPNTFYLKVGGFSILEKVVRGFFSSGKVLTIFFILAIALFLNLKNIDLTNKNQTILVSSIPLSLLVYNILIGGDSWEMYGFMNRFLTICIPFLFILISLIDKNIFNNLKNKSKVLVFLILSFLIFTINFSVNPVGFNLFDISMIHFIYWIILLFIFFSYKLTDNFDMRYLIGIIITVISSFGSGLYFLQNNAHLLKTEFINTEIGKEIKKISKPNAKIGVFWAGSIAYYSERQMIDFLGKSDSYISKAQPNRKLKNQKYNFNDFHPGHNKWNFEYSIGKLKPDLILRSWDEDKTFENEILKNNYIKSCVIFSSKNYPTELEIYISSESKLILFENINYCDD